MKKNLFLLAISLLVFVFSVNAQNKQGLLEREEALKFLKTYMPLSDIADYDEEFFIKQVDYAFKARDYFSWGKSIPDEIFRHFVLVYRVNNENLDTARIVFFNELKNRIKGMSMYDAALEVNHWCHEYVNYKAADGRTSAPLSTLRSSHGRCGEESTFAVTALRSVAIPARQCYTPRWAHTDDNHAWVEVWIDGKWYHLGACEPEPELNIAWFDAPAKRAMMVHTTVFGSNYKGKEEVNYETKLYSKINLLSNYAPTKEITIIVKDKAGKPVSDASVDFGLYNYAEYYPIVSKNTDKDGKARITTGLGDLMIWANKGSNYDYRKISVRQQDTLLLTLKPNTNSQYEETLELVPPIQRAVQIPSGQKVEKNAKRLLYEDSLRNAYIARFPNEDYISKLFSQLPEFNPKDIEMVIKNSWGNFKEIERFLTENKNRPEEVMEILKQIYEKDLRDTPKDILQSHLDAYLKEIHTLPYSKEIINQYILNPRIQLELITSWREYIQTNKDNLFNKEKITSPSAIAEWIQKNIKLNTTGNYYNCQISPRGVLKIKESDRVSREILFVAIARTLYIPAKYDWATGKAQYLIGKDWVTALDEKENKENSIKDNKSTLIVYNGNTSNKIKPEYYTHFTLARLVDGKFQTLDYEYDPKFKEFPQTLKLDAGYYRLLTGNRANDGMIYIKTKYFELKPNQTTDIFIELRDIPQSLIVKGQLDMNEPVMIENKEKSLKTLSNNKGLVIAIIDPQKEPTRHVMQDIPVFTQEFESWGGGILFLIPETKISADFSETKYKHLPSQSLFYVDKGDRVQNHIQKSLKDNTIKQEYPILLLINKKGEIVFLSEGYRIGVGENLIKTIFELEKKEENED